MIYNKKVTLLFLLGFSVIFSQEKLTKEMAVSIALEHNYGIITAKNNIKIAENNAGIYNSGYLPKLAADAGVNYNNNSSELTMQSGTTTEINNAEAKSYNASASINYLLFDGFGRTYNYKKLKETHNLSKLEAQTVIENALLQIFNVYYKVALLVENNQNNLESLEISQQRLQRANYAFEYGQTTKLQVLNAEVDVNNDSIKYMNTQRLLSNAKRDLNLLLGREVTTDFVVETNVTFELVFNYENLLQKAKLHNIEILKLNKNIEISDLNIKLNQSDLFPTLQLSSSYGWNKADNDASFNYAEQLSKGLNAGISLNWNVFDGGFTKTRIQNAKITAENLEVNKQQALNELERNVANSLEVYNNAVFILAAEEKNVETNLQNFNRTYEQFKLGVVTSIEFRQAQLNLLNAKLSLNQAKFDAKNAELLLLQLSGELLQSKF